jgi:transcriptional regulator with XRE-family HTH domain
MSPDVIRLRRPGSQKSGASGRRSPISSRRPTPHRSPWLRRVGAAGRGRIADAGKGDGHGRGKVRVMNAVARKLDSLREKGAMKSIEVANLLGTRPETVSRWKQGRAYPHASTEKTLLELEYIVDQLADFYEPNEARQWIFAPQRLLAGVSPAELIRDGRIDEVMRLVGQLRDAVHF